MFTKYVIQEILEQNLYTLVLPIIALQCEIAFSRHRTMAVMRPLKQQVTEHDNATHLKNLLSLPKQDGINDGVQKINRMYETVTIKC